MSYNKKILPKIKTPTILVIFGATGDLSKNKLIPAIFNLKNQNILPNKFKIIGTARRNIGNIGFKTLITNSLKNKEDKTLKQFAKKAIYLQGNFEDTNSYIKLGQKIKKIDEQMGVCTNKLFYLAVPPNYYETILKNINQSGLAKLCQPKWTRILIEKPFGKNIKSADKLEQLLSKLFTEKQIFRIDHYLAKETIQNILTFRFSNTIFNSIWDNKNIAHIKIKLAEKKGVSTRASFYDGVGALRDVGQNHILQMLALIAMENPKEIEVNAIRQEREKILKSLKLFNAKNIKDNLIRGQYTGFLNTKGIQKKSQTETYFKIKTFIQNKRWQGVPFILESGKALEKSEVYIQVYFREPKSCFCPKEHSENKHQNNIKFSIQPKEKIEINFWSRVPDFNFKIKNQNLSFDYANAHLAKIDAYQKVLFDCLTGDQTLFATSNEIKYSWQFITSITNNWKNIKLTKYKKI